MLFKRAKNIGKRNFCFPPYKESISGELQSINILIYLDNLINKLHQKIVFYINTRLTFQCFVGKALFLSVLYYRDIIYMHASASALKALDAVYHSAINGDPNSTHHCTSSKNVGCSSLAERCTMDFLVFMYMALSGRIACVHYIPANLVF